MIGINQTRWTRLYNNKNYTQPEAQPIKSKELRIKKIVMIACDSIKWNTEKKKMGLPEKCTKQNDFFCFKSEITTPAIVCSYNVLNKTKVDKELQIGGDLISSL